MERAKKRFGEADVSRIGSAGGTLPRLSLRLSLSSLADEHRGNRICRCPAWARRGETRTVAIGKCAAREYPAGSTPRIPEPERSTPFASKISIQCRFADGSGRQSKPDPMRELGSS